MIRSLLGALAALALAACAATPKPASIAAAEQRAPVTILISIDAFRPDYLGKGDTPNLDSLAAGGVRAAMRPSFPSLTFPNHETLVTGLRPDRNGIVSNAMFDTRRPGEKFTTGDPKQAHDPFWWAEAEPLWISAEKQGVRSATMFWPGSESLNHDARPGDWQRYDRNVTNSQRVRTVMDWLRRPRDIRPSFITLYFDAIDIVGHKMGPGSAALAVEIRDIDTQIGALRDGMAALGQPANLVIVSDHGMAEIDRSRIIDLDMILPRDSYRLVTMGPYAGIDPAPGKEAAVEAALTAPHAHMQCWPKHALPARFHYGRNPRVPAMICLTAMGGAILQGPPRSTNRGEHGYDPDSPEMAALFIASGPAFRGGRTLPVFDNVDVYPLLAAITGITPTPGIDGSIAPFTGILVPPR